jgi:hypothetical protein
MARVVGHSARPRSLKAVEDPCGVFTMKLRILVIIAFSVAAVGLPAIADAQPNTQVLPNAPVLPNAQVLPYAQQPAYAPLSNTQVPNGPVALPPNVPRDTPVVPPAAAQPGFGDPFNTTAMGNQLAALLVNTLDAYLDYLARPETAEKLATFQKNHYDALVKRGFSADQAFQLVREMGNPLTTLSANKR